MKPAFRTLHLAALVVALLTAAGCGPVLYYCFPQTRTYEYERVVSVVVRSDPAGATVVTSDGTTVGQAPLVLKEKVRVRRTYHFHSASLAVFGCLIDIGIGLPVLKYSDDSRSRQARVMGLIGLGQFFGCLQLGLAKSINLISKPIQSKDQQVPIFSTTDHIDEQVIPRPVELIARWDGLTDTRTMVMLPITRMVTLQMSRKYTFDEALVLWAQTHASPSSPQRLYQVGNAYRNLALQGVHGARERAIDLFMRYLQSHAAEHEGDAHRALDELRGVRHEK
jgi:hypothetical protein